MALPADTTWEIRDTGSDLLCGGGFAPSQIGATGVDRSQQDAAQYTFSANLTAAGTTTLTGVGFDNTMLGNVLQLVVEVSTGTATSGGAATLTNSGLSLTVNQYYPVGGAARYRITLTGGTGSGQSAWVVANTATQFTIGNNWTTNPDATSTYRLDRYESFCVQGYTNSTTVTLDRSPGTFSNQTGYCGGAGKTPWVMGWAGVNGFNTYHLKAKGSVPDYDLTTGWLGINAANFGGCCINVPANSRWFGYTTTRGDGTRGCVEIKFTSTSPAFSVAFGGYAASAVEPYFLTFDCNSNAKAAIGIYNSGVAADCIVKNFTTIGFNTNTLRCFADNTARAQAGIGFNALTHQFSEAKNCTTGLSGYGEFMCAAVACATGISHATLGVAVGCVAYACGVSFLTTATYSPFINCYSEGATTRGFGGVTSTGAWVHAINCFSFNDAAVNNGTLSPLSNITTLGASALESPSTGDFRNKSGSSVRNIAHAFPNGVFSAYPDAGMQHQDAGGGGGGPVIGSSVVRAA